MRVKMSKVTIILSVITFVLVFIGLSTGNPVIIFASIVAAILTLVSDIPYMKAIGVFGVKAMCEELEKREEKSNQ